MSLPDEIRFTGLTLTPGDILTSRKLLTAPYPSTWIRHQWLIPWDYQGTHTPSIKRLDRWVEQNSLQRWGGYETSTIDGWQFVILFEDEGDAVMFRMKGGERAFLLDESEWGPGVWSD